MQAGKLRHRVEVQSKGSRIPDAYGAEALDWATEATMWAEVRPLGVVERNEAAKQVGEGTHLITMRGQVVDVTPSKRIRWTDRGGRARIFEVIGQMDYDMRGIELRILCKEKL